MSACAARFLSVTPWLNSEIPPKYDSSLAPTIEVIAPTPWYPAGSTHVTIPMRVTDSDGVHQVFLMVGRPGQQTLTVQVKACRILAGETETIVAFEYDGVVPSYPNTSLSDPPSHLFFVTATDTEGDSKSVLSGIAQRSPYHVTTLKGQSSDFITSVAFSPDGGLLASRPGNAVRLWDVAARQHVATLEGHDAGVESVAFSPTSSSSPRRLDSAGARSAMTPATIWTGTGTWDSRTSSSSPGPLGKRRRRHDRQPAGTRQNNR